ncbi:membrane-bound PQQ-dependent dehydrogenase, glucose/quinate/shikimate family [Phenylobacterium sp.]|jgi:quinate dehydrogenase (quinone)|uniref:membrane-bound PQQ-dependent dehydrogenase, glucose/quinate/shikimate family n=1 Tax=Phenylobacterium sp. TaxID=1871053 RepID=UPI002F925123
MSETRTRRGVGYWLAVLFSLIIAAVGVPLVLGGFQLTSLGGSPYYLAAGVALIVGGVLMAMRRPLGALIYGLTLLATIVWALAESGVSFWPLLPRLDGPVVLGIVVLLITLGMVRGRWRTAALVANGLGVLAGLGLLLGSIPLTYSQGQAKAGAAPAAKAVAAGPAGDWRYYGRDAGGSRFAPIEQINAGNVENLKVAWTFRTGEKPNRGNEDQNTPMQIGDTVYVCTPTNVVIALDADTGKQKWRHDPKVRPGFWNRCRGVGYYETAAARAAAPAPAPTTTPAAPAPAAPGLCDRRIISTTIDARMFALDAATGQRCPTFGQGGVVDLKGGMGEVKRGFYFQTSTPTVAGDRVIIGGWVMDNRELGEPSGVVRAFSAETGELIWAWDLGNPEITKLPPEGQTYTRGTPNVWSTPAFDEALGLVYLPTGNATPDYWGSHRSARSEQYSSSVVALDIATGRERWKFQTVHHDVWDWDVPAQPMLVDTAMGPAVIVLTKRGQVFVLDRRTGVPLVPVEERPVPQGAAPGEWVAPTQPFSAIPGISSERLTEATMWGVTPLDQLACRIVFRKLRYEGEFTPPGPEGKPSLQYPGNAGGMNWGSGSWDAKRGLLIVPTIRLPQSVELKRVKGNPAQLAPDRPPQSRGAILYKADNDRPLGPLKTPCLEPPGGELSAVDLVNRKVVWQVPLGTAEMHGPLEMKSGLKIPLGTFGVGGPITTAGGVTFHAATTDPYLRAYDNATGKLLWQGRLPVGAGGTPMTYVSPKTGKQYVVVSAGGARQTQEKGDYVVAYALP